MYRVSTRVARFASHGNVGRSFHPHSLQIRWFFLPGGLREDTPTRGSSLYLVIDRLRFLRDRVRSMAIRLPESVFVLGVNPIPRSGDSDTTPPAIPMPRTGSRGAGRTYPQTLGSDVIETPNPARRPTEDAPRGNDRGRAARGPSANGVRSRGHRHMHPHREARDCAPSFPRRTPGPPVAAPVAVLAAGLEAGPRGSAPRADPAPHPATRGSLGACARRRGRP